MSYKSSIILPLHRKSFLLQIGNYLFPYFALLESYVFFSIRFTDYFAYTFDGQEKLPILNLMHLDNLLTLDNVSYYLTQLTLNTRRAIREVATENDPLKYLMLLGCSMHTIQDYYTHTSWTSIHPQSNCGCYRSETFWSELAKTQGDITQMASTHIALHTCKSINPVFHCY